jgi:hypothetical protein
MHDAATLLITVYIAFFVLTIIAFIVAIIGQIMRADDDDINPASVIGSF